MEMGSQLHTSATLSLQKEPCAQQVQEQLICIQWQGPRSQSAVCQWSSHDIAWLPTSNESRRATDHKIMQTRVEQKLCHIENTKNAVIRQWLQGFGHAEKMAEHKYSRIH